MNFERTLFDQSTYPDFEASIPTFNCRPIHQLVSVSVERPVLNNQSSAILDCCNSFGFFQNICQLDPFPSFKFNETFFKVKKTQHHLSVKQIPTKLMQSNVSVFLFYKQIFTKKCISHRWLTLIKAFAIQIQLSSSRKSPLCTNLLRQFNYFRLKCKKSLLVLFQLKKSFSFLFLQ